MVLLLVFMQLTRDLFAIAKFLLVADKAMRVVYVCSPMRASCVARELETTHRSHPPCNADQAITTEHKKKTNKYTTMLTRPLFVEDVLSAVQSMSLKCVIRCCQ